MRIVPTLGRRHRIATAALLTSALLAGCGDDGGQAAEAEGEPAVVLLASFYPLAEVAERVGGDRVAVTNLTPAGSEPHDLELTPDQVQDLEDADLVVVLGGGFQPAVEEVSGRRDGATLELLELLPVERGPADEHDDEAAGADDEAAGADHDDDDGHGHGDGALDPHVWLDPTMVSAMVAEVAEALAQVDPAGGETFEANARAYRAELDALDGEVEAALADCERATIVVAHEAVGWLAHRYGLRQEGIAGLSPEAEPDPARLAELTDLVEDEGITTVFTEALVPPAVAEALAREAGVVTAVLDPLEGLTEEQLADGATYASVMRENLVALREALGCR
jgi:zinc transport system substrate-binding protein